jgi:hypothetical protein
LNAFEVFRGNNCLDLLHLEEFKYKRAVLPATRWLVLSFFWLRQQVRVP